MSNIILDVKSQKETTTTWAVLNNEHLCSFAQHVWPKNKKNSLRQTKGTVTVESHALNNLARLKGNVNHVNIKPKYNLNICPQVLASGTTGTTSRFFNCTPQVNLILIYL